MFDNTVTTSRTIAQLGAAVVAELDESYTLVYADRDTLPADVVAALVRGGNEWETEGGQLLSAWEADAAADTAREVVDELANEIVHRWGREDGTDHDHLIEQDWPVSDERESALDTVRERDRSTWFDDMTSRHGAVLLRVGIDAMGEDSGLSYKPLSPEAFLDLLGYAHSEQNLKCAAEVVDNASPEFSVAEVFALLGVDLADIVRLTDEAEAMVELRNPHVWLGDSFAGGGWCSDEPFDGIVTVKRGRLRTDMDAFGYGWAQVLGGGLNPSDFGGSVAVVESDPVAHDATP